ncbi:hypothetical protein AGIG_G18019 [Arapaima gigas]
MLPSDLSHLTNHTGQELRGVCADLGLVGLPAQQSGSPNAAERPSTPFAGTRVSHPVIDPHQAPPTHLPTSPGFYPSEDQSRYTDNLGIKQRSLRLSPSRTLIQRKTHNLMPDLISPQIYRDARRRRRRFGLTERRVAKRAKEKLCYIVW